MPLLVDNPHTLTSVLWRRDGRRQTEKNCYFSTVNWLNGNFSNSLSRCRNLVSSEQVYIGFVVKFFTHNSAAAAAVYLFSKNSFNDNDTHKDDNLC